MKCLKSLCLALGAAVLFVCSTGFLSSASGGFKKPAYLTAGLVTGVCSLGFALWQWLNDRD